MLLHNPNFNSNFRLEWSGARVMKSSGAFSLFICFLLCSFLRPSEWKRCHGLCWTGLEVGFSLPYWTLDGGISFKDIKHTEGEIWGDVCSGTGSIPPCHSSCPLWFCCDSNWDDKKGLLALSWSWRVQDFGIHLMLWFSSSLWTKPGWSCLERIQNSHFPECPPWPPWGWSPEVVADTQTSYSQAELGVKSISSLPCGSFCLFVLNKRRDEEQEAPRENSWVLSHTSSRTCDRSGCPQLEDILWQQFLAWPELSGRIYYIIFCIYLWECLPHWFPTIFLFNQSSHLGSFCWIKMLPFKEGSRLKYPTKDPENTN